MAHCTGFNHDIKETEGLLANYDCIKPTNTFCLKPGHLSGQGHILT